MNFNDKNRRNAPDIWVYVAKLLAIGGWVLFIIALVISYYAAPETNYGFLRYRGIDIRRSWLTPLTGYLYVFLWFSALSSYFYLVVQKYRGRRKTDNKYFNGILLFTISIAWVTYILFHIGM